MSKPHGHGDSSSANGARQDQSSAPSGPRVIKIKRASVHQKSMAMRAEREIRARMDANQARMEGGNSEADHANRRRADARAKSEAEINDRYKKAKMVGE